LGSKLEFVCPECGFRFVVAGGYSVGMLSSCQTYFCIDCHWVFDHYTEHDNIAPKPSPFERDRGVEGEGVPCPKCSGKNTEYWNPKFPCPKCGTRMEEGDLAMLWD